MKYDISAQQIKSLEEMGFSVIIYSNKLIVEYEIPYNVQPEDSEKHAEEQFAKLDDTLGIAEDDYVWDSGQVDKFVWRSCEVEVEYEYGEFFVVINR